jgi:hypothetical protein
MDNLDKMIKFEASELNSMEVLDLFSDLIKTGQINHLQGYYQRTALDLIATGLIDSEGEINSDLTFY